MNEIKLSRMELRNFKGIKEFTIDISGLNASVFGENGTGKTTLNDAFQWGLFGKDSANRADFSVKPQDKDGNDIHFLETDVTIEFLINGRPKTFRKMLAEKWTKKRGEANKEFTGHETSYWVDTVPVKAKEYQVEINGLIEETAFKLLTNPFYFCTQLKWEDRRKTLMEICGDVTDEDVIASDESLSALTDILDGRSINDKRKIIAERIKKLNSDIEAIPIKINELSRTLLGEEVNYSVVEEKLLEQKTILRKIEQELTGAGKVAAEYRQKQQEAFALSTAMDDRRRELNASIGASSKRLIDEKSVLESERYRLELLHKTTESRIKDKESSFADNEATLVRLRETWIKENEKQFVEPNPEAFVCPTCGQDLPHGQKDERIEQLRHSFEKAKTQAMDKARSEGKALGVNQQALSDEIKALKEDLINCELRTADIDNTLAELNKEIDTEKKSFGTANYEADEKYLNILKIYQSLQNELSEPVEDRTTNLLKHKNEVAEQINSLNKILNNRDVAMRTQDRIDELMDEERSLAAQLSKFEKQKFLIEQFIKAKVNLLEDTINSRFKLVKWKLFKANINGGIEEICEALVDGVGFSSNLNHAARVNAGLDIINVLSAHYGCTAPIFIDFRESVSRIIKTQSQVINLIKSEPDKVLRVEVEDAR